MLLTQPPNKATPTHVKKHNEGLILSAIYARQSISRVQLARLTHLSRPAVTELTHGLLENGLINEIGPDRTIIKVGKRPTLLAFNPDAYHMVAVDLGGATMFGALLDLRGRIVAQQKSPLGGPSPAQSLAALHELIAGLVGQSTRPLLGIAVGTPGIVDTRTGIVHFAANLNWEEVPLVSWLSERFRLPVHIENDTSLAALGEHHFGLGQGIDDLFVITLGTGIGAGMIVGGHMVWGSARGAGEIGHIPIADSDDRCVCGRRGCLETVVSGWAIARRAQQIAREHPESLLNRVAGGEAITVLTVQHAAELGDVHAMALIERMGVTLGLALATVIHLVNPRRIILGGNLIRLGDLFIDRVRRTVHERALPQLADQTDIVLSNLDDKTVLLGAGALLLERELGLWQSHL
jgi:N-acetylglucosamine repressor